jgi:hypothetical protein
MRFTPSFAKQLPPAALLLAALLLNGPLAAQQKMAYVKAAPPPPAASSDTALLRLFEKPADLKWIRYFKGRLDDVASVDLALGYDGRNCRGFLTYPKSRTRLRLDGSLDSAGFRLQERTGNGKVTGLLQGRIGKSKLQAEWLNSDQSVGSRLEAEEMIAGQSGGPHCGDNKWAHRYISRWAGARVDMVLTKVYHGELQGYLWIETDSRTYDLRGLIDEAGAFQAEARLPGGKVAAQLQGQVKSPQAIDCTWMGSGQLREFKFALREELLLGCFEYADFFSSYDALYPRPKCPGCSSWLDEKVKTWMDRCKASLAAPAADASPQERNARRASAWTDIACWTENVFTGYLTFSETWTGQAQGLSFNFDLRTGKEIALTDLFNKSFNAKTFFEEFARKESPKLAAFAADPAYRAWLTRQGFPLYTLRREGVELSTVFHPDYGRQQLLVPYAMLKPYMKRDNPIADLVK